MPSVNVPDLNSKEFWKSARLLLWSLIVTLAVLDFLNLVTIPEPVAGFVAFTYFVAMWVVVYHAIQALRK